MTFLLYLLAFVFTFCVGFVAGGVALVYLVVRQVHHEGSYKFGDYSLVGRLEVNHE